MQKRILQIIGSTLLTALLLYAVFSEQSFGSFAGIVTAVDTTLLLVYLSLSLFGVICRTERYRMVLRDTAHMPSPPKRSSMLIITLIRNGLVDLLPARLGEASFLYVCTRYGFPLLSALSAFGVCLILDILVLFGLIVAFFFFQFAFASQELAIALTPGITAAIAGLTIFLAAVLYYLDALLSIAIRFVDYCLGTRLPEKLQQLLQKFLSWGRAVSDELGEIKRRGTYPLLVTYTVGLRVAKYLSLYVLLLAVVDQFGIKMADISPLLSTTAFIAGEAAASLPVSGLMGFGAYEGAWIAIFSISSVEVPSIEAVILAVHIITQVVGYSLALIGLVFFLVHEFRSRRRKNASNIYMESKPEGCAPIENSGSL